MTISACRGSASNVKPASTLRMILFSTLISFLSPLSPPRTSHFTLYAFSRANCSFFVDRSSPTATKSSPWTMTLQSSLWEWKRQGFALPLMYPALTRVAEYSSAQFWAASLVPYMEYFSFPTTPASPDLGSSSGSLM